MIAIVYVLTAILGLLGLVFIIGSQGLVLRIIVGIILLIAGGALIVLTRIKPKQIQLTQKIDLSGDVNLETLKCNSCGAQLDKNSVTVKAGAVFVNCGYCGATYQIEEAPKW
jgi:hypothetical protein